MLQNVLHEKQRADDRGVLVLKREKDRLLLLEECSSAPPCEHEELRLAMMLKRDALEASAEQAVQELLADESTTKPAGSPATKRANTKRKLWTVNELATAFPVW